ncbi:hypothetical protein AAIH74_37195, partial [Pseudomonas aeruginosa]
GRLIDQSQQQVDEFSLDEEPTDTDDQADDIALLSRVLITNRPTNYSYPEFLDRDSQRLKHDGPKDGYLELQVFRSQKNECPCCGANIQGRSLLRPARIGTP